MSKKYVMSNVPSVNRPRSKFDLSHGHKTSATMGYLYPLDPIEVLPGDTFKFNLSALIKLSSTLIRPVMDNLFMDVHYFFVPKRILFDKFEAVYGGGRPSEWSEPEDVELPLLGDAGEGLFTGASACSTTQNAGSAQIAAHFGFPLSTVIGQWEDEDEQPHLIAPCVLPFRAFAMIYNDFFRDENLIDPMNIVKGETGVYEVLNSSAFDPTNYTGCVPKVAKLHDLFTSLLLSPQKGEAVNIPITLVDDIPVDCTTEFHDKALNAWPLGGDNDNAYQVGDYHALAVSPFTDDSEHVISYIRNGAYSTTDFNTSFIPTNMWARAGDYYSNMFVNDLRFAFQYQKMLERAAMTGSRFIEYLQGMWGVSPGDTRLQRPEYLGGKRIPLNISQIVQTTGFNTEGSAQTLGQLGGQSQTADGSACRFVKSFTEPGYIIGTFCIRQFHSYQQGMHRMWYKKKRVDFYEPVFANIGFQPTFKYELYSSVSTIGVNDNGNPPIMGYREAWQEYRQIPNLITGQMNSDADDSLDIWHLGDVYANAPSLGQTWIEETPDNLDNCLTVKSSVQDQFIIDFWEGIQAVRCMPLYSVPGLIDHH